MTSALPGEGKSSMSCALAEVMGSDFGLRTVLVDCHPERSWTASNLDLQSHPVITDWLRGEAELQETLVVVNDKFSVMPSTQAALTARDLLQSLNNAEAIDELRRTFSLIILDLPELANPAGPALANLCDGLVLVVRAGSTPTTAINEYLPIMENVTVHGVVLNQHNSSITRFLTTQTLDRRNYMRMLAGILAVSMYYFLTWLY
jgi:Mrp family chromosome partitioning ATPase